MAGQIDVPVAARPFLPALLSHLPPLWADYLAAVIIVVAAALLPRSAAAGHRRPWLPMDTRARWRLWPGPGFTRGRWALRRHYGLRRARRVARRGRPSLSWSARRFGRWQEYASFAGWAQGWLFPVRVYTHLEQIRLVIAPPQKGKSAAAAGSIIDDQGPVVVTSIRGDLIAATAALRQRLGRILVFNPEGAGRFGSNVTWNPVPGCQDMTIAIRRAGYILEGASGRGLDEASFWQDQAAMVLAAYLHAAALAAGSLAHVHRWILDEDDHPVRILSAHPGAADAAVRLARRYLCLPDRTRAGIATTLQGALQFMLDPAIAEMLCPAGSGTLDIAGFIRSRDTLYLVAADAKHSPVPPVFTLIIAEITWEARRATAAVGRLDPPVYLELDEVANIAPVPVAAWATWAAGSGIKMSIYAQAFAQLAERWGEHGAEVLWQACDVKAVYCGSSEDALGRRVEQACGQVRLRGPDEVARAADGSTHRRAAWAAEPVLPAAMVLQLPPGRAVIIQGSSKPVLVRTEQYWRRADVKHSRVAAELPAAPARAVPAPIPQLLHAPRLAGGGPADDLAARRQVRQATPRPLQHGRRSAAASGREPVPWADHSGQGDPND
jgi:type IV secretion system protein VirD4